VRIRPPTCLFIAGDQRGVQGFGISYFIGILGFMTLEFDSLRLTGLKSFIVGVGGQSRSALTNTCNAMYVACFFIFRARRVNPNVFRYECAPHLHDSSAAPWDVVRSDTRHASENDVDVRARGGDALVAENHFSENFTPPAVFVQSRFERVAHTPNVCRYNLTHLQGASSAPTHASSRRVPRKILRVSVRGTSAPTRSKRARDNDDTIQNAISANRERVIPDPHLAPNLISGPRVKGKGFGVGVSGFEY